MGYQKSGPFLWMGTVALLLAVLLLGRGGVSAIASSKGSAPATSEQAVGDGPHAPPPTVESRISPTAEPVWDEKGMEPARTHGDIEALQATGELTGTGQLSHPVRGVRYEAALFASRLFSRMQPGMQAEGRGQGTTQAPTRRTLLRRMMQMIEHCMAVLPQRQ
ncbi:MAG: hypothetical protein HC884_10315 [Chloroflexaceae bacterium]|nr:hypothetical protein [Chloroflexaceae bacterium]